MNKIINNGNLIKKIRDGKDLEKIAIYARTQIFKNGPKDTVVLEILSKIISTHFF